jgi:hypothetical protein
MQGRQQRVQSCSKCRVPITGIRRYGRYQNKAILDSMLSKYHLAMKRELDRLMLAMQELGKRFAAAKDGQKRATKTQLKDLYNQARRILDKAMELCDESKNPPDVKVHEASRYVRNFCDGETETLVCSTIYLY